MNYGRLFGQFKGLVTTSMTWNGPRSPNTFGLQVVPGSTTCMNEYFSTADGTQAVFMMDEQTGAPNAVYFPGFTFRDIIWVKQQ